MKFRHFIGALLIALIIAGVALLLWASFPVNIETGTPDPAVSFANTSDSGADLQPFSEAYFEYKGQRLHYVAAGKEAAELVLFVHGFPSYWYSFIRQLQALKEDYRVVALDGLGAGRSDAPREVDAYRLEAMAAHVAALIDQLGAEQVHIVGHDWGAAFAFGFAQRYPERVHSVVGLSAPPQSVILEILATQPSQHEIFAYIERLKSANAPLLLALGVQRLVWQGAYEPLVRQGKLDSREGALFREATGQAKRVNAHINWYRANIPAPDNIGQGDYWPGRKARITVPAMFIWGEGDQLITEEMIAELQSIADNLVLLKVPATQHWPHVQEPRLVNQSIRAHILKYGERSDGATRH